MAGKMGMKTAMRKYEASAADKNADKAGAKKLMAAANKKRK